MSKIQAGGADAPGEGLTFGPRIMALADRLAVHSERPDALSCTYLRPAHRAAAAELAGWMTAAGLSVHTDGLGNVTGRLACADPAARTLMIGSHYDTVIDSGKYDGRLGILTGLVIAEHLAQAKRPLPFHLDIAAFAEEEGVRFPASYIGSAAVAGRFEPAWLERADEDGVSLDTVLRANGFDPAEIPSLARRDLLAYLEVHIEQGPALIDADVPVGIVSGIAGAVRHTVTLHGRAGHAGTVPMHLRRDAAAAAAEIVLFVERRCSGIPHLVGTVGRLNVPGGAPNVVPGRCEFSLDIRAAEDAIRDAAIADVLAEIDRITARRQVTADISEVARAPAIACAPALQALFCDAVARAGLRPLRLVSGAGHDAVMFAGVCDLAMLFVRCGNGGISHSPLETVTVADVDVGARVLRDAVLALADSR